MSATPIYEGFKVYQEAVMHPECPQIQVLETEQAFYAGAYHLMQLVGVRGSDAEESEENFRKFMDEIADELNVFFLAKSLLAKH
jgi:hypothetical protein